MISKNIIRGTRAKIAQVLYSTSNHLKSQIAYVCERIQDPLLAGKDPINFVWWRSRNWGDALNPYLIERLTGKPSRGWDIGILNDRTAYGYGDGIEKYMVVGSILGHMNPECVVWGAGFMFENEVPRGIAKRIAAVRGPLTRYRLQQLGVDVEPIYGDPALLSPQLFTPAQQTIHALGVIPHEVERTLPWIKRIGQDPRVKVIDICSGLESVVKEITSCSMIASSSLHGLIIADAFEIPWAWLVISDRVGGSGFKFYDYFRSTGRTDVRPVIVREDTQYRNIINEVKREPFCLDISALLQVCPFIRSSI